MIIKSILCNILYIYFEKIYNFDGQDKTVLTTVLVFLNEDGS